MKNCELRQDAFVQNLRLGGIVHRVALDSRRVTRCQRRTMCGWSYTEGGTVVSAVFFKLEPSFRRCQKCFFRNHVCTATIKRVGKRGSNIARLQQRNIHSSSSFSATGLKAGSQRDPVQEYSD